MQGHLPVVEHLCQASADVNTANNNGWTPLNVAALNVSIQSKDCMHFTTVMPWVMAMQRLYTSMTTKYCIFTKLYYRILRWAGLSPTLNRKRLARNKSKNESKYSENILSLLLIIDLKTIFERENYLCNWRENICWLYFDCLMFFWSCKHTVVSIRLNTAPRLSMGQAGFEDTTQTFIIYYHVILYHVIWSNVKLYNVICCSCYVLLYWNVLLCYVSF